MPGSPQKRWLIVIACAVCGGDADYLTCKEFRFNIFGELPPDWSCCPDCGSDRDKWAGANALLLHDNQDGDGNWLPE